MRKLFWTKTGAIPGTSKVAAWRALAVALTLWASLGAVKAQACEDPASVFAVAAAAEQEITLELYLYFQATQVCPGPCGLLPAYYAASIEATQSAMILAVDTMEDTVLSDLETFWNNWLTAQKNMTAQLSGGVTDQTRHLDNAFDSSDETQNERILQDTEHRAKKQYQPTDQGCRFDTAGRYMDSNMRNAKYIATGMAKGLNLLGGNNAGAPGTTLANAPGSLGSSAYGGKRWSDYITNFCDVTSNAGYAGCTTNGTLPHADTQPGVTIFGKETIDMDDSTAANATANRIAVQALTMNITGYETPEPMNGEVLRTPQGQEQRARDREYMAQMDAVSSLVTGLVGERTPASCQSAGGTCAGGATPEVQALRTSLGVTDASPDASEREIRQSVVEQLWDPNYWVNLGDSPGTANQKEAYLQAYNLLMLYKIIEKTEKIADVYAIESADMLEQEHGSVRYTQSSKQPTR